MNDINWRVLASDRTESRLTKTIILDLVATIHMTCFHVGVHAAEASVCFGKEGNDWDATF